MDVLFAFVGILLLPWIIFVIPITYADKASKNMLSDLNSNPVDYTE